MGTSSAWTEERRQRQREAIHGWRPWESSTGPKTPEGKRRSAMNAFMPYEIKQMSIDLEAILLEGKVALLRMKGCPENSKRLLSMQAKIKALRDQLDPESDYMQFMARPAPDYNWPGRK